MKLRLATALALAGWYLMIPPGEVPNVDAPLSQWLQVGSYDTARECKAERDAWTAKVSSLDKHAKPNAQWSAIKTRSFNQLCIASDDPRLKSK